MSYTETDGDLLRLGLPAIGHGCNCAGSMGGGVAKQLRAVYPAMYAAYHERCTSGAFRPGDIWVWETPDTVIYNLATQQTPGPDARLSAIETSVQAALTDAESRGLTSLGLPRLGSGIGGLKWADVSRVLRSIAENSSLDVVIVHQSGPPAGRPTGSTGRATTRRRRP